MSALSNNAGDRRFGSALGHWNTCGTRRQLGSSGRRTTRHISFGLAVILVTVSGCAGSDGGSTAGVASARSNKRSDAATSTSTSVATTPATDIVTTTATPPTTTTAVPTMSINGSISFLDDIGFDGTIEGIASASPPDGSPCAGSDGYPDINAGAAVTIGDGAGLTLATVPLGPGAAVNAVRGTSKERQLRQRLLDSVFDLRYVKADTAGDGVAAAGVNVTRAEQRLYDLDHPDDLSFEGLAFHATWCRLPFASAGLPLLPGYTVTIGTHGTTVYSAQDLGALGYEIDLVLE